MAMRVDLGYDREVHDDGESMIDAAGLVTVGIGLPSRSVSRATSFVSGRAGAMSFAHLVNFTQNAQFFYLGAGVDCSAAATPMRASAASGCVCA